MSDRVKAAPGTTTETQKRKAREQEKRAQALRHNLLKRKQQSQIRREDAAPSSDPSR